MEKRKLFVIGHSYGVTLPKSWCDYNDLREKEPVLVSINDNKIIISTVNEFIDEPEEPEPKDPVIPTIEEPEISVQVPKIETVETPPKPVKEIDIHELLKRKLQMY
ncbi:MAG: AbrB/MazE/SpoVT family DNA-binding domain-containing protein [archaeon]